MTRLPAEGAGVVLDVRTLSKTFVATRALDAVDIQVRSGEIVALCGQNGSGKSTLIKVLAGYHDSDAGAEITVHGEPFDPKKTHDRVLHFIHQDLALVNTLSTVENLALAKPATSALLLPNRTRKETIEAGEVLARLGVEFDLTVPIAQLSQAERTMVAIARAIDGWERDDNVLVLDEPTASLHEGEAQLLFAAVRALAAKGAGVLFVSHRLDEVLALAHRTVVFRDGRVVAELDREAMSTESIVSAMIGSSSRVVEKSGADYGETVLSLTDVVGDRVRGVSLDVRAGEIVGVSGLIGSGAETLGAIVSGGRPRAGGTVTVAESPVPPGRISAAIARGLVWAPADRQASGVILSQTVRENVTLPRLRTVTGPIANIRRHVETRDAGRWISKLEVTPSDPEAYMTQLSGGNQQKVVIAKWLRTDPHALWLDEPTQGVDVGAKGAIHALIAAAAAQGKGVVVSSTDSAELVSLCHRVLVLDGGRIVAELTGAELTEERLLTESVRRSAAHTP